MWILTILFATSSAFFGTKATNYVCTWIDTQHNTSFDLCDLRLMNKSQFSYYQVYDAESTINISSYNFLFNIGATIDNFELESCVNNSLRQRSGYPIGFCKDIYNYTCISDSLHAISMPGMYVDELHHLQLTTLYRINN